MNQRGKRNIKKSSSHILKTINDKIKFIDLIKKDYKIRTICRVIGLHHSICYYYYHSSHTINSYELSNKMLDKEIMNIYQGSNKIYGAPKIREELKKKGFTVSLKRVQRRTNKLGIKSIVIKKFKPMTSAKTSNNKYYPNLLGQDFKTNEPGIKLVGDITYIYTKRQGWTYLAVVVDLFDLKVIGYEYGTHMDEGLVIKAFNKAKASRKLKDNCIFHSDQGTQYTSNNFEQLLLNNNIIHSYSKKGYPYDNASMESFNSVLKKEEVNLKSYLDFDEVRLAIFKFI